jgi:REP element-mobilizing transposase RayT
MPSRDFRTGRHVVYNLNAHLVFIPKYRMIRHVGEKWILYTSDCSRILGTHDSKADAEKQEAAVNIAKARHKIPRKR